jgi:hypothetical protein
MSDAPQGISRSSSAASLDSFELVDATPAPEVEIAAEDAQPTTGPQIICLSNGSDDEESESESDFEEIVPEDHTANEYPPSALQVGDEVESRHASPSFTCQYFEFDDIEIDSCDSASVQLEELEAGPAVSAQSGSSTRARRRRSMAPAKVCQVADELLQNASEGLAEAASLINNLDNRIDDACPHVRNGAAYFKKQVQADMQNTAKALGEDSVQHGTATFSDFADQFKTDYDAIRKDVDSALGCLLGSKRSKAAPSQECAWPSEQEHQQKRPLKAAIPNAACSLVSVAVASWLLPVRLARFAAENIDSLAGLPSKDWRPEGVTA